MYSHGESSNAAAQRGQGFNGGYGGDQYYPGKSLNATFHHGQRNNGHQFYPEESSNASAQRGQGFHDEGFGFVSQNQRHNGSGPSGGGFNQANIPPQFHSNRNNGNGQRYNSRPRFNGRNSFNLAITTEEVAVVILVGVFRLKEVPVGQIGMVILVRNMQLFLNARYATNTVIQFRIVTIEINSHL